MATNKKITELTELSEADLSDDDVLPIVDISAGTTNKVRKSTLASALSGVSSITATSPIAVNQSTGAVVVSTGTIPIISGGTGETTANAALAALGGISDPTTTRGDIITKGVSTLDRLPIGAVNTFLKSDGTDPTWGAVAASELSGNINLTSQVTGTLPLTNGGTNATTASGARTSLGLGSIATQDSSSVTITGGSISGITDLAVADEMSYTVTTADLPSSRPSLNLNFAQAGVLDPRITYTRASTGTYYDGVTFAKAEENLLLQSQDFSTTWANLASTDTANSTAAPDGTTTADTLTESATSSIHGIVQSGVSVISGTTYAFSIFIKKGTGATAPDVIQFTWGASGFTSDVYVNYDISVGGGSSGTVTQAGASVISSSITDVGNGWYRCTFTANAGATTTSGMTVLFTNNNPTATRAPSYLGVVTADAFLWGAQLEQRSAVTDYTATTTQPITSYVPALQTAASGEARFDHDPLTGESLGFLIEEQRTNLVTYSEDFANAAWTKSAASITGNTVVAPDGTLTADKLVENTATSRHYVTANTTLTANAVYTLSIYLKAGERTTAQLGNSSVANWTSSFYSRIDLASGTITSGTGTIQSVGNGWYRVSVTGTFGPSNASGGMILDIGTVAGYTGDGYSGIYIWGAQLEAGAFPTSYIPTVASQVTRAADAASMTGTNFSSWYNAAEGTVYFDGGILSDYSTGFPVLYSINDTTSNNNIQPAINSGGNVINVEMKVANSVVAGFYPAYTSGFTKLSFAYKFNDVNYAKDGTAGTTDTSATIPVVSQLNIGVNHGGGNSLNGTIRKIAYYPKRLSDATLQALTEE